MCQALNRGTVVVSRVSLEGLLVPIRPIEGFAIAVGGVEC